MGSTINNPAPRIGTLIERLRTAGTEEAAASSLPPLNEDGSLNQTALAGYLAQQLGLELGADGVVVDSISTAGGIARAAAAGEATGVMADILGETSPLAAPSVETVLFDKSAQEGAEAFAQQVSQAFDEVFITGTDEAGNPVYKDVSEINSDDLLAVFMKLGISDPANDPRVADALIEVAKNLKKAAIDAQIGKLNEKIEKAQEAESKGKYAKAMSYVACAVIVAVAVVLSVVTFGSLAAGMVALAVIACAAIVAGAATKASGGNFMDGFLMGATIAAAAVLLVCSLGSLGVLAGIGFGAVGGSSGVAATVTTVGTLLSAALQVTTAVAKKQAADAQAEAQLLGVDADKLQLQAEERQKEIEALQQLIKAIMEGKSALVDAILKMISNKGASAERVLSIATSR